MFDSHTDMSREGAILIPVPHLSKSYGFLCGWDSGRWHGQRCGAVGGRRVLEAFAVPAGDVCASHPPQGGREDAPSSRAEATSPSPLGHGRCRRGSQQCFSTKTLKRASAEGMGFRIIFLVILVVARPASARSLTNRLASSRR